MKFVRWHFSLYIKGQFQQHFMSSSYPRRSQKRKKDSQLKELFVLLQSAGVKAVRKHFDEIDPKWPSNYNFDLNIAFKSIHFK